MEATCGIFLLVTTAHSTTEVDRYFQRPWLERHAASAWLLDS